MLSLSLSLSLSACPLCLLIDQGGSRPGSLIIACDRCRANRGPRLTHMASRFGDAIHKMAGPPSDQIKQRIDQPVAEVQDLNRMRMNASNFSMMGNSFSDSHLLAADSAFVVHPLRYVSIKAHP